MSSPLRGFEGLKVWQDARGLCRDLLPVVQAAADHRDYALSQQLNRAAISTLANIAEGYLRGGKKEYAQFVRIAAGSNGEVRACLYVAIDRGYLASGESNLIARSNEIGRMLQGLLKSLQRRGSLTP